MAKSIAIFASGTGSNAEKIIHHLDKNPQIEVALIISNRAKAGILNIAKKENIQHCFISRQQFSDPDFLLDLLKNKGIDFIVLAGFLWMIPKFLIENYPQKIVNIHPALLPLFGGKGMYGNHVHIAVERSSQKYSGMTVHFVNEYYDEGEQIFQAMVKLTDDDKAEQIAKKVLRLEHTYYPIVVEALVSKCL